MWSHMRCKNICLARNTLLAHMKAFVDKRLCEPPYSEHHLHLKAPIHKDKAKTVASLYEVVQPSKGKQNIIKVDRNILQRLVTTYREGREVNLENFLQHELMIVPLYLATTNGSLQTMLANILTQQVQTPASRLTLECLVTMPTCLPPLSSRWEQCTSGSM